MRKLYQVLYSHRFISDQKIYQILRKSLNYFIQHKLFIVWCLLMENNLIIIKISYKQITKQSGITLQQCLQQNNELKLNIVTIFNKVNSFIVENSLQKLLHIQIKIAGTWKNIMEVFSHSQQTSIIGENINGKAKIQIRLIQTKQELEESNKLVNWSETVENYMKSSVQIQKKIVRDTLRVEDDDVIDLAFFYAEPIYTQITNFPDYKPVKKQQVSFLEQTKKIQNKLKETSSVSRSANIEINVATIKNLQIALSKGVKMLHFSCHGATNKIYTQQSQLLIQSQDRTKIGIQYNLTTQNFIKILCQYKKTPEIIIFNACFSQKIAERVHNQFSKKGKHIATVGYIGQIENKVCQQFAESFYSNIFNGHTIQQSFQKSKHIDYHKTRVFYKQGMKVIFKQSRIAEKDKEIYIKNKIQKDIQYCFPRQYLFQFIKKCINPEKGIINLFGTCKVGKTEFVRKSMSYLWQRNQMNTFVIIDLRQSNYQITNFIQFQCKVESQLRKSGIFTNRFQTFMIVIDHCDSVMRYCMKQFANSISNLSVKIQPNKLIIVSSSPFQQYRSSSITNPFNLPEQYKKIRKKIKPKDKIIIQSNFNSLQYEKHCYLIVIKYFQSIQIQFLSYLSIVSLFPQQIYSHNIQQIHKDINLKQLLQKTHSQCSEAVQYIKKQIQKVRKNSIILQAEAVQTQMLSILKMIYLTAGVQFLKFYQLGSSSYSLGDQKKQKPNILHTIHSLINICLTIKNKDNKQFSSIKLKQKYEIMEIKLYFFIYFIYLRDEKHNKQMIDIIKQFICKNQEYLFKFNLKILIKVLHICKNLYHINTNNLDININNNIEIKIDFFQDNKVMEYKKKIAQMKRKLDSVHRKMDYMDERKQQNQNYERHLYQITQIHILLLPLLQIIKQQISKLTKVPDKQKIQEIILFIKQYEFLQKKGTLYESIFRNYYALYLQVLFQLQKLKLANQRILRKAENKFEVIKKFNKWIELCKKFNYYWLQKSIQAYKATSFNIFVTMVSFPLSKVFRFQNQIGLMMKKIYMELNKQIFPNIETLTLENLNKYRNLNINIPISLFVFDIKKYSEIVRLRRRQLNEDTLACLESYHTQKQYFQNINKQLYSFKCGIAIFCGHKVKQIESSLFLQNCNACIFIDTHIQRKQKENEEETKRKIKQVLDGLMFKEIILKFYYVFCKVMYKEVQNSCKSYYQQVKNAYQSALLSSKIACLNKYGMYYQEQLIAIFNSIKLQVNEKIKINKLVEKLSVDTDIFRAESNELFIPFIEKKKKQKSMLIHNIGINTEMCFSEQLHSVINNIIIYDKIQETKRENQHIGSLCFSLICQFQEQSVFLYNLLIKLRRIINPYVVWESQRIKIRKNSDASEYNLDYFHRQTPENHILFILDLTDKKLNEVKTIIESRMEQQEQIQKINRFKHRRTVIYLCKKKFEIKKTQNLQILTINKFEEKNFIPILSHQVILNKIKKKNQPRNWQDIFIKVYKDKMEKKFDVFDNQHWLTDQQYENKIKKFKQIMEKTLQQIIQK